MILIGFEGQADWANAGCGDNDAVAKTASANAETSERSKAILQSLGSGASITFRFEPESILEQECLL